MSKLIKRNRFITTLKSEALFFLVPVLSVIGLGLVMSLTFWVIYQSDIKQKKALILQDVENSAQALRLKLRRNEFAINAIARDLGRREISQAEFKRYSENFFASSPEILLLTWVNLQGSELASASSFFNPTDSFLLTPVTGSKRLLQKESLAAYKLALKSRRPVYSETFGGSQQTSELQIDLHSPTMLKGKINGMLIATYSVPVMLQTAIPTGVANRVKFELDKNSTKKNIAGDFAQHKVELSEISNSVNLLGTSRTPLQSNFSGALNTLIFSLITVALVSNIMLVRHARRRRATEKELSREISFRRAMENSLATGMRVIDGDGKITYVNPAFCNLVGLNEDELLGSEPPYPFWPPEELKKLNEHLKNLLDGKLIESGSQVTIMHSSGRRIIARMYTSPLKDSLSMQTRWLTSITDITEATRYRNEIANAQERFTTVLQSLDTAVSVASSPSSRLLFANDTYRNWFGGATIQGHKMLVKKAIELGKIENDKFYIPKLKKWFDIRLQEIKWVDGTDVELLVASDVTDKETQERIQREQYERLQQTSKLVTMGEMASSLAHELNQPLTAISNYTLGAGARIKSNTAKGRALVPEELLEILTKTAKQASRAGTVIKRIRDFVRKSDPSRRIVKPNVIVNEAIELAEIDANNMGMKIIQKIQAKLPYINVDPILIEQVLLNLIKNGLESMIGSTYQELDLIVESDNTDVIFSVHDNGPGVNNKIKEKLFESFFSTKQEGTGIGLNICRSVIESHNGKLWFQNKTPRGCSFYFTIPIDVAISATKQKQILSEPSKLDSTNLSHNEIN
ncbi:MAG: hypothetical protein CBC42_04785 [Betaproteobacteria bacterium TMED82]|nr:MAG: hypothetical protein CBC42_04785 [Betaproteobacteria bacterium TMED82]|tara:strand:- start:5613 stop:8018 length:2406 start_codon:yes stop_codon:yes gene_type:complete